MIQAYQRDFIEYCLDQGALRFGEFKLKSGRMSPYFFNAGVFNTGEDIKKLGEYYAAAIQNSKLDYEVLFGPAYKGIPLVVATAIALRQVPYAFNRKEVKDHGEGGQIVGAELQHKKVLIIDDVITAGTAVREAMQVLQHEKATLTGVIISVNRQERGQTHQSAIQEVQETYGVPVVSIITMTDLMTYLREKNRMDELAKMEQYRKEYGV